MSYSGSSKSGQMNSKTSSNISSSKKKRIELAKDISSLDFYLLRNVLAEKGMVFKQTLIKNRLRR